jgi:hypothetical protein
MLRTACYTKVMKVSGLCPSPHILVGTVFSLEYEAVDKSYKANNPKFTTFCTPHYVFYGDRQKEMKIGWGPQNTVKHNLFNVYITKMFSPESYTHQSRLRLHEYENLRRKTIQLQCKHLFQPTLSSKTINPLNAELNPICHLLALLGAHPIFHVSRVRVNSQLCQNKSPKHLPRLQIHTT